MLGLHCICLSAFSLLTTFLEALGTRSNPQQTRHSPMFLWVRKYGEQLNTLYFHFRGSQIHRHQYNHAVKNTVHEYLEREPSSFTPYIIAFCFLNFCQGPTMNRSPWDQVRARLLHNIHISLDSSGSLSLCSRFPFYSTCVYKPQLVFCCLNSFHKPILWSLIKSFVLEPSSPEKIMAHPTLYHVLSSFVAFLFSFFNSPLD